MAKKQLTIQLSETTINAIVKEAKKKKKAKQVIIDERLKESYGL
jgi:ribosomal protein L31E